MKSATLFAAIVIVLGIVNNAECEAPVPAVYTLPVSRSLPGGEKIPGYNEATMVGVLVPVPDRVIVALDAMKSKLTTFMDNKGTKLNARQTLLDNGGVWGSIVTNKSNDKALVNFSGNLAPVPGATSIHLKAAVVLICGKGEKKDTLEDFSTIVNNAPARTTANFAIAPGAKTANIAVRSFQSLELYPVTIDSEFGIGGDVKAVSN